MRPPDGSIGLAPRNDLAAQLNCTHVITLLDSARGAAQPASINRCCQPRTDVVNPFVGRACLPALGQEGLGLAVVVGDAGQHGDGCLQLRVEAEST